MELRFCWDLFSILCLICFCLLFSLKIPRNRRVCDIKYQKWFFCLLSRMLFYDSYLLLTVELFERIGCESTSINGYLTFWTGKQFLKSSTSGNFFHFYFAYVVLQAAIIIKYTRLETAFFFLKLLFLKVNIDREIFCYNSQWALKLIVVQLLALVLVLGEFVLLEVYIVCHTVFSQSNLNLCRY